jgi:MFS family permease
MRWRHPAVMLVTSACFGLCCIGFGLSSYFWLSIAFLFGTGLMDVIGEVIRATIIQLRVPDELRGRVSALTIMFTNGGPQLGQLQGGAIASAFGPAEAAVIGGTVVVAASVGFMANPHMRRGVDISQPADISKAPGTNPVGEPL